MRTLRIAITALIWAAALAASADAAQTLRNSGVQKDAIAPTASSTKVTASAVASGAQPAMQSSYRYETPDAGPPTPGPTDPNTPAI
jgi:hypothetical protein